MTIRVIGGNSLGYKTALPVLEINHQLNAENIENILHYYAAAAGAAKVLSMVQRAIGLPIAGSQGAEYYCSVEGMHAPRLAHRTLQAATVEAERLANLNPGRKVLILEAKGYRQVEVTKVMKGAN